MGLKWAQYASQSQSTYRLDGDKLQKRFWKFMSEMGHKIDLGLWHGYRGDMGKGGVTYYGLWDPKDGLGTVDGM